MEKVKEIKKALVQNSKSGALGFLDENRLMRSVKCTDILTYINELEEENERLERRNENLINKRYEEFENFGIQWENDENNKKRKTNKYLKNFSMELWLYYQQQYTNNQQLKDRIAELEKENARLDKVTKHFQELIEDGKLISSEELKQFAERLKEKYGKSCSEYYPLLLELTSEQLDETLKDFIK